MEDWHGHEDNRITCLFGPQGPDMVSKELLLEIKELAQKYDTGIHMHVAQGDREIDQMIKRYGKRSIPWLDELGYLDDRLLAVHLTEATREETQLLAQRGASMILCSGSIGIIDGIVPPAAQFLEISDRLALGSDQAPGNNCNNMFNEMKFTAILNKCKARDPKVFPAWQVLRLATIDGARAIGLGHEVGSLWEGKKADLILVDLNSPAMCPAILDPVRNIVPNLVYSANGSEVEMVIIDGKVIMEDRTLLSVDEKQAVAAAQQAAAHIYANAKPDQNNIGVKMMKANQL
jgi:5-methylthioadenosine/S-adenosylhomocysteine deaminase